MKLKLGDKVQIKQSSEFYIREDNANPIGAVGEIYEIKEEMALPIYVKWENAFSNSYEEIDLELIKN